MSIRTGPWSKVRRWLGVNRVFLNIMQMAGCVRIAYFGNRCYRDALKKRQDIKGSAMMPWAMLFSEILGPGNHVGVTLTHTT